MSKETAAFMAMAAGMGAFDHIDEWIYRLPKIGSSGSHPTYGSRCAQRYSNTDEMPKKIERNAPCPCGSGLKYKKCCINKKENSYEKSEHKNQTS